MSGTHHIVVSAENSCYMAWQCKLFHYSCVSRLGQVPVIIVHELDQNWHPYFGDIVAAGGTVRFAPSYRRTKRGGDYSPRNTPGTLLQAAEIGYKRDDFIVLCDADMIFLGKTAFARSLSAEGCTNLNYDKQPVQEAAQRFGISAAKLKRQKSRIECAVPHVIPVAQARQLAETWLEAIDSFTAGLWETSMYAFGLSIIKLNLPLKLTYQVALNNEQQSEKPGKAKIIHYSYGDKMWNKRHYWEYKETPKVWKPALQAPKGTVLEEIVKQIREADEFYSGKSPGYLS